MRVLVAPDSFAGTLTAPQAAEAIARGWRRAAPDDEVITCPLADGGPGFVAALHATLGGELSSVTVTGPLGEPVPATLLRHEGTAYVEAAQAAGLGLVPEDRRDPALTTSFGVGELLAAAIESGAHRVVVGVGGTATNDGGAGLLAGLAGWERPALRSGGGALSALGPEALADLGDLRHALEGVELLAAVDDDAPLLGLHGTSAVHARAKGASAEQAQELEKALGRFAHLAEERLRAEGPVHARPLPVLVEHHGHQHAPREVTRLAALPGAGAGGGLGFGLALLGARLEPGARLVARTVELAERIAGADLVVTGEGRLDWRSLHDAVVSTVAETALATGRPTVVVVGQVEMGRREWMAAGVSAVYAVAETLEEVDAALADPEGTLEARAARVGKNWSR